MTVGLKLFILIIIAKLHTPIIKLESSHHWTQTYKEGMKEGR